MNANRCAIYRAHGINQLYWVLMHVFTDQMGSNQFKVNAFIFNTHRLWHYLRNDLKECVLVKDKCKKIINTFSVELFPVILRWQSILKCFRWDFHPNHFMLDFMFEFELAIHAKNHTVEMKFYDLLYSRIHNNLLRLFVC